MNKFIRNFAIGAATILIVMAFTKADKNSGTVIITGADEAIEIPEDVNAVLKNYCFGCHNTESKNQKGKDKLTIDGLSDLPTAKLAAKLNKIAKEIEEGEMPPKKFLEKYPEKEPSKKEKKTVVNWAKSTAKSL